MTTHQKWAKKILKKESLSFLVMALLIEKRSPPLLKVYRNKNVPQQKCIAYSFKICVLAGNECSVVVTLQIFLGGASFLKGTVINNSHFLKYKERSNYLKK